MTSCTAVGVSGTGGYSWTLIRMQTWIQVRTWTVIDFDLKRMCCWRVLFWELCEEKDLSSFSELFTCCDLVQLYWDSEYTLRLRWFERSAFCHCLVWVWMSEFCKPQYQVCFYHIRVLVHIWVCFHVWVRVCVRICIPRPHPTMSTFSTYPCNGSYFTWSGGGYLKVRSHDGMSQWYTAKNDLLFWQKVRCKLCVPPAATTLAYHGGTTSMQSHLSSHHPDKYYIDQLFGIRSLRKPLFE